MSVSFFNLLCAGCQTVYPAHFTEVDYKIALLFGQFKAHYAVQMAQFLAQQQAQLRAQLNLFASFKDFQKSTCFRP